jgi:hypothetical protein
VATLSGGFSGYSDRLLNSIACLGAPKTVD